MRDKTLKKLQEKEKKNPGVENRKKRRQMQEAERGSYVRETRPTRIIEDKRQKKKDKAMEKEARNL